MITDEFEHYFRICITRKLSSEEAKQFLFAVSDNADVEADNSDVVMVYHLDDETQAHCYDVRLATDITAEQGDDILFDLEDLFEADDFECESSMDTVSEQLVLNRALMEQLNKSFK